VRQEGKFEYFRRMAAAKNAPKATSETRVLLIAAERGLTKKQLEKFYVQRRKDWKPLFNYQLFAEKQGISLDWLFHGDLREHPRGPSLCRTVTPRVMSNQEFDGGGAA
jgi:hypothetical protein